jgi:hypothetical protein
MADYFERNQSGQLEPLPAFLNRYNRNGRMQALGANFPLITLHWKAQSSTLDSISQNEPCRFVYRQ